MSWHFSLGVVGQPFGSAPVKAFDLILDFDCMKEINLDVFDRFLRTFRKEAEKLKFLLISPALNQMMRMMESCLVTAVITILGEEKWHLAVNQSDSARIRF